MKTVNYFWYGVTGFVESYVSFFSTFMSLAAAFAIVVVFPLTAVMITVFSAALLIGVGLAIKQTLDARNKAKQQQQLEHDLAAEYAKKEDLKKQYHELKEINEQLFVSSNLSEQRKLILRRAHAYTDFLYDKSLHMNHDEREAFLATDSCHQLNILLPKLQDKNLSESEFATLVDQLENLVKPMISVADQDSFNQKYKLNMHYSERKLAEHKVDNGDAHSTETHKPQVSLRTSIGVG
ncbi:MAG: hypothetical protein ACK4PR_13975, partial [Gammaproteobacteria bacterium]